MEWEQVRARLEVIAEELADLGRARLRQAVEAEADGQAAPEAVAQERRLASARRAVLRAVAALGGGPDEDL